MVRSEFSITPELPLVTTEMVQKYQSILSNDVEYDAWSINNKLEVINCKGIIKNNESYNYHNNYDDSEDRLFVRIGPNTIAQQWFTLNKEEAIKIQQENLSKYKRVLNEELSRVRNLSINNIDGHDEELLDLVDRAAVLVGNQATNISKSGMMYSNDWLKEYKDWLAKTHHNPRLENASKRGFHLGLKN